jgi:ribosomal protein S18 acetylase RimI-like enzyme
MAVGYIVLTFRYTMEHGSLSGHVDDLFVRTVSRGQRIGFALLSNLLDECRNRNFGAIYVEVASGSAPATALYRSLGFEEFQDGRLTLQTKLGAPGA